jgi:hypothetical protein
MRSESSKRYLPWSRLCSSASCFLRCYSDKSDSALLAPRATAFFKRSSNSDIIGPGIWVVSSFRCTAWSLVAWVRVRRRRGWRRGFWGVRTFLEVLHQVAEGAEGFFALLHCLGDWLFGNRSGDFHLPIRTSFAVFGVALARIGPTVRIGFAVGSSRIARGPRAAIVGAAVIGAVVVGSIATRL